MIVQTRTVKGKRVRYRRFCTTNSVGARNGYNEKDRRRVLRQLGFQLKNALYPIKRQWDNFELVYTQDMEEDYKDWWEQKGEKCCSRRETDEKMLH